MTREQLIIKLSNELRSSEELKIVSLCNNLENPISIFEKNYSELQTHLEKHAQLDANKGLLITQIDKKIELIEYMNELNRLVHNYVTSSKTLIDLQRIHYTQLNKKKNNFPEYNLKIESEFAHNTLCAFIQSLRNYFLHRGIPKISSIRSINETSTAIKVRIQLDKKHLLDTYNWNKDSEKFLTELEEHICISDIFKEYHNHILNFQNWYKKEQEKIFLNEHEFVSKKENEIKTLGIEIIFDSMKHANSFSRNIIEQQFLRYINYKDSKDILETTDEQKRGQKVIASIRKTKIIPVEILILIMSMYDIKNENNEI